eukprot:GHRR01026400.1.p2 GENE.GHRR01026400.1~~GHRR01026400.1.p2  ORF type:complete len:130 (-),score=13.28 GHRR01026400.1:768-1157(-)
MPWLKPLQWRMQLQQRIDSLAVNRTVMGCETPYDSCLLFFSVIATVALAEDDWILAWHLHPKYTQSCNCNCKCEMQIATPTPQLSCFTTLFGDEGRLCRAEQWPRCKHMGLRAVGWRLLVSAVCVIIKP